MGEIIGYKSNLPALRVQRELQSTTARLSRSFERLSTGLRINHAVDDSAGLQLALRTEADSRITAQAARNVSDGISAASIADAALAEVTEILNRQYELAQQAGSELTTLAQRRALQDESDALVDEYNRILSTVNYNGRALFSSTSAINLQAGSGAENIINHNSGSQVMQTIGDGTAASSVTISQTYMTVSGSGYDEAIGDVNGDGYNDIAHLNADNQGLAIHLGNGDGTFRVTGGYVALNAGETYHSMDLADINNDGFDDYVVSGYFVGAIKVGLSNGDGTFRLYSQSIDAPGGFNDTRLVDLNGDGHLDLVNDSSTGIYRALGNGDGTFARAVSYAQSTTVGSFETGDVDGDGIKDVVIGQSTGSYAVLLGNGDGSYTTSGAITGPLGASQRIAVADFNRDGLSDLAMIRYGTTQGYVALSNGDGTFALTQSLTMAANAFDLIAADVTGDGYVELIASITNGLSIHAGNGDGSFDAAYNRGTLGTSSSDLEAGDLNNDGLNDFVFTYNNVAGISLSRGTRSASMPHLNLLFADTARDALEVIDSALLRVENERGIQGATLNRLEGAVTLLSVVHENYRAAYARITEIDVAHEVTEMVRDQILEQAQVAVLAQANLQPQIALSLIAG